MLTPGAELGSIHQNLSTLDVSFNRISALPSTIGTLSLSLTRLRVSDNDLEVNYLVFFMIRDSGSGRRILGSD